MFKKFREKQKQIQWSRSYYHKKKLLNATKKLKSKKAVYSDKISNEMIKASIEILSHGFLKVFNIILTSRLFPELWSEGLITPIYKSWNSQDPNNYRGICVLSCMGKLFISILNARLMNFAKKKQINSPHPNWIYSWKPNSRSHPHT